MVCKRVTGLSLQGGVNFTVYLQGLTPGFSSGLLCNFLGCWKTEKLFFYWNIFKPFTRIWHRRFVWYNQVRYSCVPFWCVILQIYQKPLKRVLEKTYWNELKDTFLLLAGIYLRKSWLIVKVDKHIIPFESQRGCQSSIVCPLLILAAKS